MKFSPRGIVLIATLLFCFPSSYFTYCATPMMFMYVAECLLGKKACIPFVRAGCNAIDFARHMYSIFMSGCLQLILGIRVGYTIVDSEGPEHLRQNYVKSDGRTPDLHRLMLPPSKRGTAKIIMMNHHCRIDPLCAEALFAATGLSSKVHIVPKRALGELPIVGWAMQLFRFLFLSREWAKDEGYLRTMIRFIMEVSAESPVIFLFPEGTDLSESNVEKSNAFARAHGLPEFRHVLNPRTTGFIGMKNFLGENALVEVFDVTVGYVYGKNNKRPSEPSLANGEHPRKMHFVVRRYPAMSTADARAQGQKGSSYAPTDDDEALSQWVHDRFAEKEQLLSRFASSNPQTFDDVDVKDVYGQSCGVATYDEDVDLTSGGPPRIVRFARQVGVSQALITAACWFSTPFLLFAGSTVRNTLLVDIACGLILTLVLIKKYGNLQIPLYEHMVSNPATKTTKAD